jgi:hypothetical protein
MSARDRSWHALRLPLQPKTGEHPDWWSVENTIVDAGYPEARKLFANLPRERTRYRGRLLHAQLGHGLDHGNELIKRG